MKIKNYILLLLLYPGVDRFSLEIYGKIEQKVNYQDIIAVPPGTEANNIITEIRFTENILFQHDAYTGYAEIRQELIDNDPVALSIYKAYSMFELNRISLVLGKTRLYEGVAQNWNPADLINPRKATYYSDEREREADDTVFLSSLSFFFFSSGGFSQQINVSALPEYSYGTNALNLSTLVSYLFFDLFFSGIYDEDGNLYSGGYVRTLFSSLNELTLYSEWGAEENFQKPKIVWGAEINLTPNQPYRLQLQAEYFTNDSGYNSVDDYFSDQSASILTPGYIQKEYYYLGTSLITQKWRVASGLVLAHNDNSGLYSGYLSRRIGDEVDLALGGYHIIYDDSGDEYKVLLNNRYELYFRATGSFSLDQ